MGLYLSINFNDLKDLNLLKICLFSENIHEAKDISICIIYIYVYYLNIKWPF